MRHLLPTTLGLTLFLGLACGGNPGPEDTWVLADDSRPIGGDDSGSGGDDTGESTSQWVGSSWIMDVQAGTFAEPAGVGSVLASYLEAEPMLFEITQSQQGSVNLRVGGSTGGEQDTCVLTEVELADVSGSRVSVTDEVRVFALEGAELTLEDFRLSGTLNSSGWSEVTLEADLDTRPLGPLVDESGDPGALCELMVGFGATCEPCADGTPYCLPLLVEDIPVEAFAPGVETISDCGDCWGECRELGCATGPRQGGLGLGLGLFGLIALGRRRRS